MVGVGSDSIAFLTVGLLEIRRKAKSADHPSTLEQSGPRPSFHVRTVRFLSLLFLTVDLLETIKK